MTTQSDEKQSKIERALRILALTAFTTCLVLTVLAECERANWALYLVAQLRLQLFALSMLTAAIFGVLEYPKKFILIVSICALLNGRQIIPIYFPTGNKLPTNAQTLRVLQINLNSKNQEFQKVSSYIHRTNPDILLISELTPNWVKAFQKSLPEYPNVTCVPREDTYGIGVYSKSKFENAKIEYFGPAGHPSVTGTLGSLEKPVTILHTHIQGPVKDHFFEWHKEHFEKMTMNVLTMKTPLLVSGDTNSNTWSYLLSDFLQATKLRDSRQGRGVQLTWPVPGYWRQFPFTVLAIDHYFVSPEIVVVDRKIGEDIGSDHFPVYIEFGLQSASVSTKPR